MTCKDRSMTERSDNPNFVKIKCLDWISSQGSGGTLTEHAAGHESEAPAPQNKKGQEGKGK